MEGSKGASGADGPPKGTGGFCLYRAKTLCRSSKVNYLLSRQSVNKFLGQQKQQILSILGLDINHKVYIEIIGSKVN